MSTVVLSIHGRFEEFEGDAAQMAEHLSKARIHRRLVKLIDPHGFAAYVDPWAVSMIKQGETLERSPRALGRHLESVDPDAPEEKAEGLRVCPEHGPYDYDCVECAAQTKTDSAKYAGSD